MTELAATPPWDSLLRRADDGRSLGHADTVREICQQPLTWEQTADEMLANAAALDAFLHDDTRAGWRPMILTGSGSSLHVAECLALRLQTDRGVDVRAVPAALLLTHADGCLPRSGSPVVVSFARSGDSPESAAVLDLLLDRYPACRHLAITCNAGGRLATGYVNDARVLTIVLDARTNDRSLVMTSSFTNMAIAGQALGLAADGEAYRRRVGALAMLARDVIARHAVDLARIARLPFASACFLGTGARLGAARESALKMLEMSSGGVRTIAETPLGLRHGPMAAVRDDTLVVAGLPSSALARGYAVDVLREIAHKRPTGRKVIVGAAIPPDLIADGDAALDLPALMEVDDEDVAVLDVVVGQILALFRCLAAGLRPDAPSPDGMINRVVPDFPIYR
jgi:tagatose-6-phosphate ketose/aldose isomerase